MVQRPDLNDVVSNVLREGQSGIAAGSPFGPEIHSLFADDTRRIPAFLKFLNNDFEIGPINLFLDWRAAFDSSMANFKLSAGELQIGAGPRQLTH